MFFPKFKVKEINVQDALKSILGFDISNKKFAVKELPSHIRDFLKSKSGKRLSDPNEVVELSLYRDNNWEKRSTNMYYPFSLKTSIN